MESRDLTATSLMANRLVVALLVAVGLYFLFRPRALGWDALARSVGGESALVSGGVGMAFLLLALAAREMHSMRVQSAEVAEGLNQLLYGTDYARDREAVEILLDALDGSDLEGRVTAHKHLLRLTGQNLAADPRVWRSWWAAHQRHWSRARLTADPTTEEADGPPDSGPVSA